MARQTVAARSTPQGKGKKAGLSAAPVPKRASRTRGKSTLRSKTLRPARSAGVRHLDAVVRVGTAITFAPTGERLRVTKIEKGEITFEKLP